MILVDTSVWVSHFRDGEPELEKLLGNAEVMCHPFIVGELACGSIRNRSEILSLLQALPMASQAEHEEVLRFIKKSKLIGKGLGYIDVHLIASAALSAAPIWTLDKQLDEISAELSLGFAD